MLLLVPFIGAGLYFAVRDDFLAYRTLWTIAVPTAMVYAAVSVMIANVRRS